MRIPPPQDLLATYELRCRHLLDQIKSAPQATYGILQGTPGYTKLALREKLNEPVPIWDENFGNLARSTIDFLVENQLRDLELSLAASYVLTIWRLLLKERIEPQRNYGCSLHVAELSIWNNATVSQGLGSLFLLKNLLLQPHCNGALILTQLKLRLPKVSEAISVLNDSWEDPWYYENFAQAKELAKVLTPGEPWGTDHLLLSMVKNHDASCRAGLLLRQLGLASEDVQTLLLSLPRERQQQEWPEVAKLSFAHVPAEVDVSEEDVFEVYEARGWALVRALRPWCDNPSSASLGTLTFSPYPLMAILHHQPDLTDGLESRFYDLAIQVHVNLELDKRSEPKIERLAEEVISAWEAIRVESQAEEWQSQFRSSVTQCLRDASNCANGFGIFKSFLSMPQCDAYKALASCGVQVEKLAEALRKIDRAPQESRYEEICSRSHSLSLELPSPNKRHRATGTSHLLLALLEGEPNDPVPSLLSKLDVEFQKLRDTLVELQATAPGES